MGTATVTTDFTEILPSGLAGVRLTTGSTSDTYICPYFSQIIAAVANNESGNDGVSVGWDGQTITLGVATGGDVVTLLIAGRQ